MRFYVGRADSMKVFFFFYFPGNFEKMDIPFLHITVQESNTYNNTIITYSSNKLKTFQKTTKVSEFERKDP